MSHTSPNITFAISVASQHIHYLKKAHIETIYKFLKYLKGSSNIGLFFKKNKNEGIEALQDVHRVGYLEDKRFTTGYCIFEFKNSLT